ncbi:enoyl-CoA hydratase-related protein [Sphingomonas sp. MG17]|uniref:Enoyl-CoA hydratase-related protein n=1 Tax=Sphingomonas tagetis TaxID=2949092 RepID=A0A9X2HGE9_9SPHN|nr:enoyl-CoA hydratase-related protein [Sphingomonas tagetis]
MQQDDEFIVEIAEGLARVIFNRPTRLNALTARNIEQLKATFRALARDRSVRAVMLTGVGRAFCVGADLTDPSFQVEPGASDAAGDHAHGHLNLMIRAIKEHPKPVVAAVNGLAVGGGMSIALAADIVVAARSATFSQVFTPKVAIVPDAGSTWTLPRAIGAARAAGMMFLGEPVTAERACDWGMIWNCVADDALATEAERIAQVLARGPTASFGLLKRALQESSVNTLPAQLDLEAELNRIAFASHDAAEAVRAFTAKRAPQFKGE